MTPTATEKATTTLQDKTREIEETEKREQDVKAAKARLDRLCEEIIIKPLTTIIVEAERLYSNYNADFKANDTKVDQALAKITAQAETKISTYRGRTEKSDKEAESNNEAAREARPITDPAIARNDTRKNMYIRGYEKGAEVINIYDYIRKFTLVHEARKQLTEKLNSGLQSDNIKVISQPLSDTNDPGTSWFFFEIKKDWVDSTYRNRTKESKYHLTVHLGTRISMHKQYDQGKVHFVHTIHDVKQLRESVNLYPYDFTKTTAGPDPVNPIGPDTCMQVIPIYPPDPLHKNEKDKIAKILNTFLYDLQVKAHLETQWAIKKLHSGIDNKFQNFKISLQAKSNIIKKRLKIKEVSDFIPKAIEVIRRMTELFLINDYKECIEYIKKTNLIKRYKSFLTKLSNLLPTQINQINRMNDADGNDVHLTEFNTAIDFTMNLTELTNLLII